MIQPPIPASARVFPLTTKAAKIRWKTVAQPASTVDWSHVQAYGLIADGFCVIDFDDDASRSSFADGNFKHFIESDGLTVNDFIRQVPTVKTPHGYHAFFAADDRINQGQGFPLPNGMTSHVDVRSCGKGYVVGPGSVFVSDAANAAKHPAEPVGTQLRYEPLFRSWPAELPRLDHVLPSVYRLVAKSVQPGFTTSASAPVIVPADDAIAFRPEVREAKHLRPFDGRDNWQPASWIDGINELAAAQPGTRHSIAAGVARFLWRFRNKSTFCAKRREFSAACMQAGLPAAEISHIYDDFVGSKIASERAAVCEQAMAAECGSDYANMDSMPTEPSPEPADPAFITNQPDQPNFIMNAKGDNIVDCEENIRLAIRHGYIKIDDMAIDARGDLVHLPTREMQKRGEISAHSAAYEATAVLVGRIDRFIGGSMRTRSTFLPIAIDEIGKVATESLAPDFFAAITSPGPTVPIEDLVQRMGIDATPQIVRWIEACLLQALRRMLKPASPLENILLLWGPQRTHKSTFVPSLFDPSYLSAETGEYRDDWSYTDTLSGDLKDEQSVGQRVKSKFALEIPELTAFRRTRDVGALRDVITRTHDSYRAPYAKVPEKQPRTCTFIGTSNEEPELGDQYGNRRFCVVKVARPIDTSWICQNRNEIWRGLYLTLKRHPGRCVLSVEEQAAKEESLESNAFLAIPFFAEICDALKQISDATSNEVLPLTDIMRELTTEKDGPHLPNTDFLRRAVHDVLRHLHASRRPGRYPSYVFGAEQRDQLKTWMTIDQSASPASSSATPASSPSADQSAMQAEIERLRAELQAATAQIQALQASQSVQSAASPVMPVTRTSADGTKVAMPVESFYGGMKPYPEYDVPPAARPVLSDTCADTASATNERVLTWLDEIFDHFDIDRPKIDLMSGSTWRSLATNIGRILRVISKSSKLSTTQKEIMASQLNFLLDDVKWHFG